MIVLGIETSCDETAAGIVGDGYKLHANAVLSSMDLHAAYGGVVPEIAARNHIEAINPVIDQAMAEAKMTWEDIDALAVTYGAGLGGSLLIGVLTARTLAIIKQKPLYAINHVEAHIYANFLTEAGNRKQETGNIDHKAQSTKHEAGDKNSELPTAYYVLPTTAPAFPMLGLIVSGGHTQLVLWQNHFDYRLLGQTHDDAIGEAFDKVAKITGLPYPGGPSIAKKAAEGDPLAYKFPKAKMANKYDFSFSGIKTAVLRKAQELVDEDFTFPSKMLPERLSAAHKANLAASFQRVAIETVVDKTITAFEEFKPASVVIGGGVAANLELRRQLAERLPVKINYQDSQLMTDNGAMVAALGCFQATLNQPTADPYSLKVSPGLSM